MLSLCLLAGLSVLAASSDNNTITLKDIQSSSRFNSALEYWIDDQANLNIHDVIGRSGFQPVGSEDLSPAYTDSAIWLRFELANREQAPSTVILQILDAHLDLVSLYGVKGDQVWYRKSIGLDKPFEDRHIDHHWPAFEVHLPPGFQSQFYLRVESGSPITIPLRFFDDHSFHEHIVSVAVIAAIHLAIIFAMAIYNQFLIFATRDINYFYYGLCITTMALVMATTDGWQMSLLPDNTWAEHHLIYFLAGLSGASVLLFVRGFLKTHHWAPILDRLMLAGIAVNLFGSIFASLNDSPLAQTIPVVSAVASVLVAFIISSLALVKGIRVARFLVAGWAAVLIGALLTALANTGLIPPEQLYREALKFAQIAEAILMSFALGERFRNMRRSEQEAKRAAELSSLHSQAKTEFLAQMSHEIRTPMNGVIGMTELLKQTPLDDHQNHFVDVIDSSGRALLNVINDILDFSKIEAGKMRLENTDFDLEQLVQKSASVFSLTADHKGVPLLCHVESDVPLKLIGDPTRLRQVLLNLIGNAFKFTNEGLVRLNVSLSKQQQEQCRLKFEIIDSGIGIPQDRQAQLFEAFTQADQSTTRQYGGTGLGLTISNKLVQLMDGTLQLQSEVGQGSNFWFEATFGYRSQPHKTIGTLLAQHDDKRILLVGEADQYSAMLQKAAADIHIDLEQRAAQQALKDLDEPNAPWAMFVINASQDKTAAQAVAEKLRQHHNHQPVLWLHTLNDGINPGFLAKYGISKAITLPITTSHFLRQLVALLDPSHETAPAQQHHYRDQRIATFAPATVLVAEDNQVNQIVIKNMLAKLNVKAVIAGTGKEAWEKYNASGEAFSLILMDCEMPEWDGFKATQVIRENEQQGNRKAIPIIALTAHADTTTQAKCLSEGMNDYLSKPVTLERLKLSLSKYL